MRAIESLRMPPSAGVNDVRRGQGRQLVFKRALLSVLLTLGTAHDSRPDRVFVGCRLAIGKNDNAV